MKKNAKKQSKQIELLKQIRKKGNRPTRIINSKKAKLAEKARVREMFE